MCDAFATMGEQASSQTPVRTFAQVAFIAIAATLVYSFISVSKESEMRRRCAPTCLLHPEYAGADRKAPSFSLKGMRGETVSLDDYRGKVVLLNFWTKTCGPCMEEMPDLVELTRVLQSRPDVAVVTVSTDDGPEEVRATLKALLREDPPFPIGFDPDLKVVREKYGTRLFPETWIIDKEGIIRARFDGPREWTGGAIPELIDQIRAGGYCPIDIKNGQKRGQGLPVCETVVGG
jgi:peroxiredoxin